MQRPEPDNTAALNRIDIAKRRYHAASRDLDARWAKALATAKEELQEAKKKAARRAAGLPQPPSGTPYRPAPGRAPDRRARSGSVKSVLQTGIAGGSHR